MRIASGIITLAFMAIVAFQSYGYQVSATLTQSSELWRAGLAGWVISALLLFGGAFVFKLPRVAANFLTAAFLVALFVNVLWAILTIMPLALTGFAIREIKKAPPARASGDKLH